MLKIDRNVIEAMLDHGRSEAPLEACGYLAAKDGVICKSFAMKNMDASPVHYSMDPKEQFAALKSCRQAGLTLKAVYHTHPETPAYPSAEDIKLAYDPDLSYVIVSLVGAKPSIHSFIIKKNQVTEEQIKIIGAEK